MEIEVRRKETYLLELCGFICSNIVLIFSIKAKLLPELFISLLSSYLPFRPRSPLHQLYRKHIGSISQKIPLPSTPFHRKGCGKQIHAQQRKLGTTQQLNLCFGVVFFYFLYWQHWWECHKFLTFQWHQGKSWWSIRWGPAAWSGCSSESWAVTLA